MWQVCVTRDGVVKIVEMVRMVCSVVVTRDGVVESGANLSPLFARTARGLQQPFAQATPLRWQPAMEGNCHRTVPTPKRVVRDVHVGRVCACVWH